MKKSAFFLALCLTLLGACGERAAPASSAPAALPTASPIPVETPAPVLEPPPTPAGDAAENTALDGLRGQVREGGSLCGALYLGYELDARSDSYVDQVVERYPWAGGCSHVDAGGEDLFLLVPATDSVALTIQAVELSEGGKLVSTGETLYTGVGEAVLLRCNVSDLMPNTLVTAAVPDRSLEFSPSLSLRDGSVYAPGAVDLTAYPEGFEFARD